MNPILRTGDVMEIKPASVFEVTRLGAIALPKANRISLFDLQKPLKKIYLHHRISASKSISTESTKLVAGTQGINLGEFSGPNSHSAPANSDIHTCIPSSSILSHMVLYFHFVPIDKKSKKFKGTFKDATTIGADNSVNKKLGDEYIAIESKEQVLLEKTHPFLFTLVYKKSPESLKQVELVVFSCICELQAIDIRKALSGELLNQGGLLSDEQDQTKALSFEGRADGADRMSIISNQNFHPNVQSVHQDANFIQVENPYNLYGLNNQPNNQPISQPNIQPNIQPIIQPNNIYSLQNQQVNDYAQQNPYMMQQPMYSTLPQQQMPQMAQQHQPAPQPQQFAQHPVSMQPQFPGMNINGQQNIFTGQFPAMQPVQQVPQVPPQQQQQQQIPRYAAPPQQLTHESYYADDNKNAPAQPAPQQTPIDKPKAQLQSSSSFYGRDYYNKSNQQSPPQTAPSAQNFNAVQQQPAQHPPAQHAPAQQLSASQMRLQQFAPQKEQSTSSSFDQDVFSPPVATNQAPFVQSPQNPVLPNSAPAQNPYILYGSAAQIQPTNNATQPQPQQPARSPMSPSGMIMGAPMESINSVGSSYDSSVSTPSTGGVNDPSKPVALVMPRKVRGVAVLPFPVGGLAPQPNLLTAKTSDSDPDKIVEPKYLPPQPQPQKTKPPNVLQKPTFIDKASQDKPFASEQPTNEVFGGTSTTAPTPMMAETMVRDVEDKLKVESSDMIQEGLGYLP